MAFPFISGFGGIPAATNATVANTNKLIFLPIFAVAGQTFIALLRSAVAGGPFSWPSGWTELFGSVDDASNDRTAVAWRKADGTETNTELIGHDTSAKFAAIVWLIGGAADPTVRPPEFAPLVTGTSNIPDPGSLSPTGGAKDYLWIWMGGWEGEQASPPAGNPANYTLARYGAHTGDVGSVASNCRLGGVARQLNAATEDPPGWTISAPDDWTATVIAVYPISPIMLGQAIISSLNSVSVLGRKILYGRVTSSAPSEVSASGSKVLFGVGSILATSLMKVIDPVVRAKVNAVSIASSLIGPTRNLYPRRLYSSRVKLEPYEKRKKRIRYGMELKPGERMGSHHKRAAVRGAYGPEVKKLVLLERLGPRRAKEKK